MSALRFTKTAEREWQNLPLRAADAAWERIRDWWVAGASTTYPALKRISKGSEVPSQWELKLNRQHVVRLKFDGEWTITGFET